MARITYVKEIKNSTLLRLGISEGEENANYTVSVQAYSAIGRPVRGDELEMGQMEEIRYSDSCYRAEKKALSLLAFSDNSVRTLKRKLCERGFSREIARECAEEMVRLGYIREDDQIERLIINEANSKLRGPGKIIPAIVNRGYSSSDVRRVLADLVERGEIDFRINRAKLIDKSGLDPSDTEEVKKLLFKNGYKV